MFTLAMMSEGRETTCIAGCGRGPARRETASNISSLLLFFHSLIFRCSFSWCRQENRLHLLVFLVTYCWHLSWRSVNSVGREGFSGMQVVNVGEGGTSAMRRCEVSGYRTTGRWNARSSTKRGCGPRVPQPDVHPFAKLDTYLFEATTAPLCMPA